MTGDPDTPLARSLFAERRHDVAALQALLAEARAGGPTLAELLVARGLLRADEARERLTRLGLPVPASLAVAPAAPAAAPAADRLGDYVLLSPLGAGGMGTVYLAEHVPTGARRAVKVIPGGDRRVAERFRREGEAQARLDGHPNVLRVHAAGEAGGRLWIAMDLAEGGDLAERLEKGPLPIDEATRLVATLARGLDHAHRQGVLHRDVKPSNVLFDRAGTPLLVDFGLARLVGEETLTKTGAILGTPAYMAPEQARGGAHDADARADVYGLGAVLYHCLTGRLPFDGVGMGLLAQVMREPPPPPRALRPELSPALEAVCLRALEKAPAARHATALDLALALESPPPVQAPAGRRWLLAGAVLLLVTGGVSAALLRARSESSAEQQVADALARGASASAEITAVTSEAWSLVTRADGPTGDAATGALAGLRARLDARRADAPTPAVAASEALLDAALALVALEAGDTARSARLLESLAGEVAAVATDAPVALVARAVRGGLVGALGGDARAAADDLDAAAPAIARPSLVAWRDRVGLRLALDALARGEPAAARAEVAALRQRDAREPLAAEVVVRAQRDARVHLSALEGVPEGSTADSPAAAALEATLDLVLRLRPDHPPLEGPDGARLERLAFDEVRKLCELAPLVAAGAPGDLHLQRRTIAHASRARWRNLEGEEKREVAARYVDAVDRALAAAPGDVELQLQRCEQLLRADRPRDCAEAGDAILARSDALTSEQRGRAHYWRANGRYRSGRVRDSIADFDAALEHAPSLLHAYFWRARARWAAGRQARPALDDAQTFLLLVDGHFEAFFVHYPFAAMIAWAAARKLDDVRLVLPGLERMVATFSGPDHAGWRLRLAFARLRAGEVDLARAELERALPLVRRNARIRALAAQVEAVLAAPPAQTIAKAKELIDALEAKRPANSPVP